MKDSHCIKSDVPFLSISSYTQTSIRIHIKLYIYIHIYVCMYAVMRKCTAVIDSLDTERLCFNCYDFNCDSDVVCAMAYLSIAAWLTEKS